MTSFTLDECAAILPLIRSIAAEIVERRNQRRELDRTRTQLETATTPEGLAESLADLDARIFEHDTALHRATHELELMGLILLRTDPLTIHFPGRARSGEVVFCWQEGEPSICHGHAPGEEEEPRRPLMVRVVDAHKP